MTTTRLPVLDWNIPMSVPWHVRDRAECFCKANRIRVQTGKYGVLFWCDEDEFLAVWNYALPCDRQLRLL